MTTETLPTGPDELLARAARLGGPHHTQRARPAAGLRDVAEGLLVVLASLEGRVAALDGLAPAPERRGQVLGLMHAVGPGSGLRMDPSANFPRKILEAIAASLRGVEARLAAIGGTPDPGGPKDPVSKVAAGAEATTDAAFAEAFGLIVPRVLAADRACDLATKKGN